MRTLLGIAAVALALAAGTAACGSAAHPGASSPRTPAIGLAGRSSATSASTAYSVTARELVSADFASPQRGYGLFEPQGGTRCEAIAARTTDGGAKFGPELPVTSWNCNTAVPPVTSIAADSAGDVFAYGPELFIYRNATGKFAATPQRGTVQAVSAVGRSVWMLLARCRASNPADCSLDLVESANGGRTWQAAKAQPGGTTHGGSLLRTSSVAGYLLADPVSDSTGKADSAVLWHTGNTGRTWSHSRVPCGQDAVSAALARAPGGQLVVVCASEDFIGMQGKMTTLSANGGKSWTKPVGCVLLKSCPDDLLAGYTSDIAAVSAKTIYLIGYRGPLLVTSDGGLRWREVGSIGAINNGVAQVVFFGKSDGVVFGDNFNSGAIEIWHTTNGGRTWSKPVVPRLR
jgi:photosystem II stability/assembly factor-like uncharacterized protein